MKELRPNDLLDLQLKYRDDHEVMNLIKLAEDRLRLIETIRLLQQDIEALADLAQDTI